jgi:hypothetical protein
MRAPPHIRAGRGSQGADAKHSFRVFADRGVVRPGEFTPWRLISISPAVFAGGSCLILRIPVWKVVRMQKILASP